MRASGDVALTADYHQTQGHLVFGFAEFKKLLEDIMANKALLGLIQVMDRFYSELNGSEDFPVLRNVIENPSILDTEETVKAYAASRGLPVINPRMGLGLQILGDRNMAIYQAVSDLADKNLDANRIYTAAELLSIVSPDGVLNGRNGSKAFLSLVAQLGTQSFFDKAMDAMRSAGSSGSAALDLNDVLTFSTSMSEMLILGAKVSRGLSRGLNPEGHVYLDPAISPAMVEKVLATTNAMLDICQDAANAIGAQFDYGQFNLKAALDVVKEMAESGKPIGTLNYQFDAIRPLFNIGNPVTAVQIHLHQQTGEPSQMVVQWAAAPREIYRSIDGRQVVGINLIFLQGISPEPMRKEAVEGLYTPNSNQGPTTPLKPLISMTDGSFDPSSDDGHSQGRPGRDYGSRGGWR
jgi:hypothetical protein